MKKVKGFTLIELIVVLVIMAILALIVTPLVMSIIRKIRVSADKRSIDAYGRSIELAIAGYLLDHGTFPTEVSQLTIEYSGEEVVCSTTQLNSDSSVYLEGCTVGGRSVDGYTYGKEDATYETYTAGDSVEYNGVNYYVLSDSNSSKANVMLIKETPITSEEISPYISASEIANKVNLTETYATMAYYSRDNCVSSGDQSGCSTDYSVSDVKQVVDIWTNQYTNHNDLVKDSTGYKSRLITFNDIENVADLEIVPDPTRTIYRISNNEAWLYSENYWYWTMTSSTDFISDIVIVESGGKIRNDMSVTGLITVRPVINISKSAL